MHLFHSVYIYIYIHSPSYFYAASTTQPQILLQLCSFYDHSLKYWDINAQTPSLHYCRIYTKTVSWNKEHEKLPSSQPSAVTRKINLSLNKAISENSKTSFIKLVLLPRPSSIISAVPLRNRCLFFWWLWSYISPNSQTDFEFESTFITQLYLYHRNHNCIIFQNIKLAKLLIIMHIIVKYQCKWRMHGLHQNNFNIHTRSGQ